MSTKVIFETAAKVTRPFRDLRPGDCFTTEEGGLYMVVRDNHLSLNTVVISPMDAINATQKGDFTSWAGSHHVIVVDQIKFTALEKVATE